MPMDTIYLIYNFYNAFYWQKISMNSRLGKLLEKLYIIFFEKSCPKICIYQEFFVSLWYIFCCKKNERFAIIGVCSSESALEN